MVTKSSTKRAYQSSSMAHDNNNTTPTQAVTSASSSYPHQFSTFASTPSVIRPRPSEQSRGEELIAINYGEALSADIPIPIPIPIPSGTILIKKPRRSSLEESETEMNDAPLSPPTSHSYSQPGPSQSKSQTSEPIRKSSISTSSSNIELVEGRPLDARPRQHPSLGGEKIQKPTTPGRKEARKRKRFSTLPYTYTASESPDKKGNDNSRRGESSAGNSRRSSRNNSPRKNNKNEMEWEEGREEIEHGDFIGFGIKLQQEDR